MLSLAPRVKPRAGYGRRRKLMWVQIGELTVVRLHQFASWHVGAFCEILSLDNEAIPFPTLDCLRLLRHSITVNSFPKLRSVVPPWSCPAAEAGHSYYNPIVFPKLPQHVGDSIAALAS